MSWDVVLFNSKQKTNTVAKLDENQLELADFSGILENSFDQIKKDENHRKYVEQILKRK
jgi:predicted GTPase